jgi:phosphoadenosine phosphosulfate reductase
MNIDLDAVNAQLANASPQDVLAWAHKTFGPSLAMTSSFGNQSAVLLHLATQVVPDIPVIAIDTGYLFPETYTFMEELRQKLHLNLKVFSPAMTAARQEALYGKLWEQGEDGLKKYLHINKVEPMNRAIQDLGVKAWVAGLRKQQTEHRATLRTVELQDGTYKIHPILNWTSKDIHGYLTKNGLSYHPLDAKGYKSIGDTHSTFPVTEGMDERAGRKLGTNQECGLHVKK